MKATLGLVTTASSSVRQSGFTVTTSSVCRLQAHGLARDDYRPSVDLAKEIRHVVGDDIDDSKLLRFEGGQARGAAHGLGRPVRVAPMEIRRGRVYTLRHR